MKHDLIKNESHVDYCKRCRQSEGTLKAECPFFNCKKCSKLLPLSSECHSGLCHDCSECSRFIQDHRSVMNG